VSTENIPQQSSTIDFTGCVETTLAGLCIWSRSVFCIKRHLVARDLGANCSTPHGAGEKP